MVQQETHQEDALLAVLNSTPVVDGVRQELLANKADRRGRDALQKVVRGAQPPTTLAEHLEPLSYSAKLTDDGLEWVLNDGSERSLIATAVLAWDTMQKTKPGRLRPCANPECELFLIDHSKANTARWCSMAVCGNRMKARRHHERSRLKSD